MVYRGYKWQRVNSKEIAQGNFQGRWNYSVFLLWWQFHESIYGKTHENAFKKKTNSLNANFKNKIKNKFWFKVV